MNIVFNKKIQISARSSTDRASDYGSEGSGFESLRAHKHYERRRPNGLILYQLSLRNISVREK